MFQLGFQISIYLPGIVECGVWDTQMARNRFSYIEIHTFIQNLSYSSVLQGSPTPLDILKRIGITEISVELAGQALDKVVASGRTTLSEEQIDVGEQRDRDKLK